MREALALRLAVALACLVPLVAGAAGALWGGAFLGLPAVGPGMGDADSHLRYLSGLLLGIGLGFLSTIPRIEVAGARFRLLTGLVVLGGLARLGGVAMMGWPAAPMLFGLIMELAVTPALCLWRERVARAAPARG